MVLDLPADIAATLEEKARESGLLPAQYVSSLLRELWGSGDYQVSGFADENDTPISHEEAAPMIPGVLRGLEDVAAGRCKPLAQVVSEARKRHRFQQKESLPCGEAFRNRT